MDMKETNITMKGNNCRHRKDEVSLRDGLPAEPISSDDIWQELTDKIATLRNDIEDLVS